MIFLT